MSETTTQAATILPVYSQDKTINFTPEQGFDYPRPILLGFSVRTGEPNGGRTYTLLDRDGFVVGAVNRQRQITGALLTALIDPNTTREAASPEFTALYSDAVAKLAAGEQVTDEDDSDYESGEDVQDS